MAINVAQDDVRECLRNFIEDKGYIKAHLAVKAGMTPAKLSGVLTKKRKLEANELLNLCIVMGISPDDLIVYRKKGA